MRRTRDARALYASFGVISGGKLEELESRTQACRRSTEFKLLPISGSNKCVSKYVATKQKGYIGKTHCGVDNPASKRKQELRIDMK